MSDTNRLHALLAVEPDLKGQAEAITAETIATFTKKADHFHSISRTYQPVDENGETLPPENKEMVTTVRAKLDYTEKSMIRYLDALYQKEMTNTVAKADLVVDGITIAKDVPATELLNLENRFKHIREIYRSIPTLDPGYSWDKDLDYANVYKAAPQITVRTTKVQEPLVLYPATDKHPAQVNLVTKDVLQGRWTAINRSGKLAPIEKSELIERVEKLLEAIKTARCKANDVVANTDTIGAKLFAYINGKFITE